MIANFFHGLDVCKVLVTVFRAVVLEVGSKHHPVIIVPVYRWRFLISDDLRDNLFCLSQGFDGNAANGEPRLLVVDTRRVFFGGIIVVCHITVDILGFNVIFIPKQQNVTKSGEVLFAPGSDVILYIGHLVSNFFNGNRFCPQPTPILPPR